jgi:hypothetical protein
MSDQVIDRLRIIIGGESGGLEGALDRASAKLSAFGANVAKAGAALGAGITAAAIGLGVAMEHAIDKADELGKAAQRMGIPVEQLSTLASAAGKSGIGIEQLSTSVSKLSKNMSALAGGKLTGDAEAAFEALHVSVTKAGGGLKGTSDIIVELAGKFAGFEDGAAKSALAIAIFGKSGAEMIPLLNKGSEGLRSMMEEAQRLGLVIDEKTAKSAEAFNQSLTRLGKVKDSIVLKISVGLLPALESVSGALVKASKDSDLMKTASDGLNTVFKFGTEVGMTLVVVIQRVSAEINGLVQAAKLMAGGEFSKGFAVARAAGEETDRAFAALHEKLATFWDAPAAAIEAKAPEIGRKLAAPVISASTEAQRWHEVYEQLLTQHQQIFESARTPAEQLAFTISQLSAAYERGGITAETFSRATQLAAERAKATWDLAGASIAGSFATIAGSFSANSKSMLVAGKAFAIVQAIISTYTGMAKALEMMFPANIAAAAVVAAKGFAFVAAIQGQTIPTFATGGTGVVGGSGGVDSQLVSLRATPGEIVSVQRPDSLGGGQVVNLTLNGDRFRKDDFRDLIESINGAIRMGYRINLV